MLCSTTMREGEVYMYTCRCLPSQLYLGAWPDERGAMMKNKRLYNGHTYTQWSGMSASTPILPAMCSEAPDGFMCVDFVLLRAPLQRRFPYNSSPWAKLLSGSPSIRSQTSSDGDWTLWWSRTSCSSRSWSWLWWLSTSSWP